MKIRIYAELFMQNAEYEEIIEVDKEEWDEMNDKEKREYVMEELISGSLNWGWEELE